MASVKFIEKHRSEHIQFLEKQYAPGYFILLEAKNSRLGKFIISLF